MLVKRYVRSLSVLVVFALAVLATIGQETKEPLTYVGMDGCVCHKLKSLGNQIGHWREKDPHAKAYESLRSEESKKVAARLGIQDPVTDARCNKCHATFFAAPEAQRAVLSAEDGVMCESCHGPGSGYAKKNVMSDPQLAVANGLLLLKDAEERNKVCGTCHNKDVPEEFRRDRDFVTDWAPLKHSLSPPEE